MNKLLICLTLISASSTALAYTYYDPYYNEYQAQSDREDQEFQILMQQYDIKAQENKILDLEDRIEQLETKGD